MHLQDIAVVDIPAHTALEYAVHVISANTADRSGSPSAIPTASYPRLAVRVGDGSALRLRQSFFTVDKQGNQIQGNRNYFYSKNKNTYSTSCKKNLPT